MIPKLIHIFAGGPHETSGRVLQTVLRRLNPEYKVSCSTTAPPFIPAGFSHGCEVANYFRWHSMYHQGGWWIDADTAALAPLPNLESEVPLFATNPQGKPTNCFIASPPGNELFLSLMLESRPQAVRGRPIPFVSGIHLLRRELESSGAAYGLLPEGFEATRDQRGTSPILIHYGALSWRSYDGTNP